MKNQISLFIIIGLVAVILLQRLQCGSAPQQITKVDTVVKIDTCYIPKDSIIKKKVTLVKVEYVHDTLFVPSGNYDSLKAQYVTLANTYSARKSYMDSLRLGTIGYVLVYDTVQYNALYDRSYKYHYDLPVVTKEVEIIKYAPQKSQLYIGGGVAGSKNGFLSVQAGVMYKSPKDKIVGGFAGVSSKGDIYYGVQSYWKIRFK